MFLYDDSRTDLDCYFTVDTKVNVRGTMSAMRATMFASAPRDADLDLGSLDLGSLVLGGPETPAGGTRKRAQTGQSRATQSGKF